jgi:putative tryptophan/tyrosine transport system substrate-binding protein
MIQRRDFITLLCGAAAAWPLAARGQQSKLPVIGILSSGTPDSYASRLRAFQKGLNEAGFVEGRNVSIIYRWAEGQYDRLPALAADLVRRKVAVIFANGLAFSRVKAGVTTIPVVFQTGVDPVAAGYVASLNRPGGNVTGTTSLGAEVAPKRLELLHEVVPSAKTFAMLLDGHPNTQSQLNEMQVAARTLGVELEPLYASAKDELDAAFATLVRQRAGGLVISNSGFLNPEAERLAELSVRHAVPAVHIYREFVAAGGLMAYGGSLTDSWRLAGGYVGRILMGEKPGGLPVQQATKFELAINLKTAKALGLTIPPTLLAIADEVIE